MSDKDEHGRTYENTFECVRKVKKRDDWWVVELRPVRSPLGPMNASSIVKDGLTDKEARKYELGAQYDIRMTT